MTSATVGLRIPHASAGILRTFYPSKWHSDSTSLRWETSWLLYITYLSSTGLFYWVKRQQLYEWMYSTWRWRRHVSRKQWQCFTKWRAVVIYIFALTLVKKLRSHNTGIHYLTNILFRAKWISYVSSHRLCQGYIPVKPFYLLIYI